MVALPSAVDNWLKCQVGVHCAGHYMDDYYIIMPDVEQYMECQSAYYRNFNDHGRLLRLRRLYHAIFFGGAKCIKS